MALEEPCRSDKGVEGSVRLIVLIDVFVYGFVVDVCTCLFGRMCVCIFICVNVCV